MPVIVGSNANDDLSGTDEPDVVRGLGGQDLIGGGHGNDELEGGDGNDFIEGGAGDDLIRGGAGDDSLSDEARGANDRLHGEDGDDYLRHSAFAYDAPIHALLDGGSGNDRLYHVSTGPSNHATLLGGDGNDSIRTFGGRRIDIDAGTGADHVEITGWTSDYNITLGPGSDLLLIASNQFHRMQDVAIVVADFQPGEGGDALNFISFLARQTENWTFSTNPFATDHLRIVQNGADAVIQYDRDGPGTIYGFANLITLRDVTAQALTARNLSGYAADGSVTAGIRIDGTTADDLLSGASGNDTIQGLGSNDVIYGGDGADWLEGGDGRDTIEGESGDDLILGGAGDDWLNDTLAGNDRLFGEGGNDQLLVDRQWFFVGDSFVEMDGGVGNDRLLYLGRFLRDDARLIGGVGDDYFEIVSGRSIEVDAGSGADYVYFDLGITNMVISLGAGTDTLVPRVFEAHPVGFTVLDFEAGNSGDQMNLWGLLPLLSVTSYSVDLFAQGFFRLGQNGADTLLLFDGTGVGGHYTVIGRFSSVDAAEFTRFNFGYDPLIRNAGSGGADHLFGTRSSDELVGLAGDDILDSGGGADRLYGHDGNDVLLGGVGRDSLVGAGGNDRLQGGAHSDEMDGGDGADIFVFTAAIDSTFAYRSDGAKIKPDVISRFVSGEDKIDLSAVDADSSTAVNDAFTFIGVNAFSGRAGELRLEIRDGRTTIFADTDGDRVPDFVIVAVTPALEVRDFIL